MLVRFITWLRILATVLVMGIGLGILTLNLAPEARLLGVALILSTGVPGAWGQIARGLLSITAVVLSVHLLFAGEVAFAVMCILTAIMLSVIDMDIIPIYATAAKLHGIQSSSRR